MVIDIIVLVILFISAVIAFLRGFIREVLTIAGVLGGMAAAYVLGPKLAPLMRGWLDVEDGVEPEKLFGILPYNILADMLAYGAVFIVVVIILSIISHTLAESARAVGLGPVDRTLGVIFGLVRGILLLGLLYLPAYLMVDKQSTDDFFEDSRTHSYLESTAGWLSGFLPDDAMENLNTSGDDDGGGASRPSATRERLEQLDLLRREGANISIPDEGEEGYGDDIRREMDQLFEQREEPRQDDLNE